MRIDPNSSIPQLRLVRPPESVQAPQAAQPAPRRQVDSFQMDSLQLNRVPRTQLGEAQQRLERIRSQLTAARTNVPVHFDSPPVRSANPYAAHYLKLSPPPAERDISATEAANIDRSE